jgi:hypothetical protein
LEETEQVTQNVQHKLTEAKETLQEVIEKAEGDALPGGAELELAKSMLGEVTEYLTALPV